MEIEINGIVTVPDGIDADKFSDEFIDWIESKGYTFGGKLKDSKEGFEIESPDDAE